MAHQSYGAPATSEDGLRPGYPVTSSFDIDRKNKTPSPSTIDWKSEVHRMNADDALAQAELDQGLQELELAEKKLNGAARRRGETLQSLSVARAEFSTRLNKYQAHIKHVQDVQRQVKELRQRVYYWKKLQYYTTREKPDRTTDSTSSSSGVHSQPKWTRPDITLLLEQQTLEWPKMLQTVGISVRDMSRRLNIYNMQDLAVTHDTGHGKDFAPPT
ncbi:hypothetical protein EC957_002618 [Mortierella hygrophila]|uniref:Uncharacterized protein n=1 Tax=Mortierella hygrophila TaxID=979708 RepID=A0A9P6F347_9FUNG|nr:hypothetical protein EC957_002618 [Mortierella hygrophila]